MKAHAFPPARGRHTDAPWIMHVPVVSTTHITKADDLALTAMALDGRSNVTWLWAKRGYLLCIEDGDTYEELSPEANALLAHFTALGYAYLRLDPDGDAVDSLPTFDW